MRTTRPIVLKFGGSVLTSAESLPLAVTEIYRHVRLGRPVVAVVSALRGRTDELLRAAEAIEPGVRSTALAALVRLGEFESAALLALALERSGIPAQRLDPEHLSLVAIGPAADARPVSIDAQRLRTVLESGRVAVLPGFVATGTGGEPVLLGRGGSDLTAVFLASAIDAEVRLIKSAGVLGERDPTRDAGALTYESLTWRDAARLAGSALQPAAIDLGARLGRPILFTALGRDEGTLVGAPQTVARGPAAEIAPLRPVRVGLLGLGTVGGGVARRLTLEPERYEIVGAVVRDPSRRRSAELAQVPLVAGIDELLDLQPDVIIEALGGVEPAQSWVREAIRAGAHVVSANKALIAEHGESLAAGARAAGVRLAYSAAVGGVAPMLETVRLAAREGPIVRIRGILNGTSNFVLDRLRAGRSLDEAVRDARSAGYAEADPSLDLEGIDAAHKLTILAREGLGVSLEPHRVWREPIDAAAADRLARAASPRWQVASAVLGFRGVRASVRLSPLAEDDPLFGVVGAGNALEVTLADGRTLVARGAGAGRWPTAEAVLADLNDIIGAAGASLAARSDSHHQFEGASA